MHNARCIDSTNSIASYLDQDGTLKQLVPCLWKEEAAQSQNPRKKPEPQTEWNAPQPPEAQSHSSRRNLARTHAMKIANSFLKSYSIVHIVGQAVSEMCPRPNQNHLKVKATLWLG